MDRTSGGRSRKILDEIFKEKVEAELVQLTFIIDHPVSCRRSPSGSPAPVVERFELFTLREIANAFSELNDQ
jgi:lysyl-tRNA synthetase class 2